MRKKSYYQNKISNFLHTPENEILGELTYNHHFALDELQKNAWLSQIRHLKAQLGDFEGTIFFEFSIPRMGKRADIILLINKIVFVLEYKNGAKNFDNHSIDQTQDYALDLKNFHQGSHNRHIIPILIATKAPPKNFELSLSKDNVATPLLCNEHNLKYAIKHILESLENVTESDILTDYEWANSGYKPTPTIIEAAQALYRGHSVEEISRSDSGIQNLKETSQAIIEIIKNSKKNNRKSICFITGVPGAGKTLAGLNISTQKFDFSSEDHAVFLSGNGPLVHVLKEALTRDKVAQNKYRKIRISKKHSAQEVNAFIQNIHHFRDAGLSSKDAPSEHVVIFDEAQRAWNQKHAENFMIKKRGAKEFNMSEPHFLISYMDRHPDWCTIVCLIGGGQEINTGEAGLVEWINALEKHFPHWDIYHSKQLSNKIYNWGENLNAKLHKLNATPSTQLHLSASIRSFRAEKLSDFIGVLLDNNAEAAIEIKKTLNLYDVVLTRDLQTAKNWLHSKARGSERYGLTASSGAIRLKAEGLHVKQKIDPSNWFLNDKNDIRSSYHLEDIATEFDIQGLELDWIGVGWDADLRRENDQWGYYNFKGTKWQNVNDPYQRSYLINKYRVLLTRARQGMVIFVPKGCSKDYTRLPKFYNPTYEYLKLCGITEL